MTGAQTILTLNAGSSSIKFALFSDVPEPRRIATGEIENIDTSPRFRVSDSSSAELEGESWSGKTYEDFTGGLLSWAEAHAGSGQLAAVGHRIVHGGGAFASPARLTADVVAALDRLSPLAPLHQPHNLNAVRTIAKLRPDLAQIGCFDTAFHRTMPPVARRFALPRALEAEGVCRYGFHGLSYEYIAERLRRVAPHQASGRIIVAHLGNGASLCGMRNGESIDTTMGLTALDGLAMGTRCGALDPGVALYLMRQHGFSADDLEDIFYRRSGLLGVSGISADMRTLLASSDPRAAEAIDLFVFRIAREIGAMAASLGGLDGLVFTAGIGENAPQIRRRVCELVGWLGISLDPPANDGNALRISTAGSPVTVWAIATDEEAMIARHVAAAMA
jgi:acetate kinase